MRPLAPDHTPTSSRLAHGLLHAKDLPKPQLAFSSAVDNYESTGPSWPSLMPVKQHAMVPIGWQPSSGSSDSTALETLLAKGRSRQLTQTLSPYAYETLHLQYPNSLFNASVPIPPVPFATTPFTFVETVQQLKEMVEKLKAAREIAVDLEHNGFRSYNGIVCLMQISTREEDWVVDTLALRQELTDGQLGGVLVDPSIVKVFHGSDSDIIWLQQNFGMFVVGLFDTYHATKVLGE
jgi:exosome complex exonuclease RRP6